MPTCICGNRECGGCNGLATNTQPALKPYDRGNELVKRAISTLHRPSKQGDSLWSVVGMLFGLGSGSATQLCIKHGFDPDVRVKRRLDL